MTDEEQIEMAVWMTGVLLLLFAIVHGTSPEDQRACLAQLCDLTSRILARWESS